MRLILIIIISLVSEVTNPPIFIPITRDVLLLAATINAECGSCSEMEKRLVGVVILNRVYSPIFPNTIEEVIMQDSQFIGVYNSQFIATPDAIKTAQTVMANYKYLGSKKKSLLYFFHPQKSKDKAFVKSMKKRRVYKFKHHSYYK